MRPYCSCSMRGNLNRVIVASWFGLEKRLCSASMGLLWRGLGPLCFLVNMKCIRVEDGQFCLV